MSESVILCEGYTDRAFWKGWLTRLECKNARRTAGGRADCAHLQLVPVGWHLIGRRDAWVASPLRTRG